MHRQIAFTIVALIVTATTLSAQSQGQQRRQGSPSDSALTMDHDQMDHGQMDHGQMQHGQSEAGESSGHGGSEGGGMMGGSMMEHMRMMRENREGGGMGGGMGGGTAATDVGGPGPAEILGMVEELDLSADQIGRLGEIRERLATARKEHQQAMEAARESARRALEVSPPDLGAYEESLRQEADYRIPLQVAAARAGSEARGILTAAQLEQLQEGMSDGMMVGGGGMSH